MPENNNNSWDEIPNEIDKKSNERWITIIRAFPVNDWEIKNRIFWNVNIWTIWKVDSIINDDNENNDCWTIWHVWVNSETLLLEIKSVVRKIWLGMPLKRSKDDKSTKSFINKINQKYAKKNWRR